MKKLLLAISLLLVGFSALADTPVGPMNYQGRLLDNAGIPVTGTYDFVVRVYDATTNGTLKYQETHIGVPVNDGVYNFLVGTAPKDAGDSTWSVELWNCCSSLYLELSVSGQTLLPRSLLAAAPYAYQANLALTTNNALALGGKTAAQYNSTLANICVSGKGKWLEIVGKCLGVGSQFPGPTLVSWNTLTASSDFSNLDLTRADISGINFSGTYMTNTTFKQTTYAVAGMSGVNLSNTVWDSAIATDTNPFVVSSGTNLSGATMKNMNMSKWNLSPIATNNNLQHFSAAYLTACPAAVFGYVFPNTSGVWKCNLMRAAGSQYFMVGPYANFSITSAAATTSYGEVLLDVDSFDNTDTSAADFSGVTLTQSFLNGFFYTANLTSTTLRNISFTNTNFNGTFVRVKMENIIIGSGVSMNNNDWTEAKLTNVRISSYPYNTNFTRATLTNVDFDNGVQAPNFTDAVLTNVRISYLADANTKFVRTRIMGDFNVAGIHSSATGMLFQNVEFDGAIVSGALTDVNFTGTIKFTHTVFKNLDLCSVTMPLAGGAPHAELADVKWEGPIECPDGSDLLGIPAGTTPLYSNTCNYLTRMTNSIAVGSCTAGIPGGLQ